VEFLTLLGGGRLMPQPVPPPLDLVAGEEVEDAES
jgi:hypothetical protein